MQNNKYLEKIAKKSFSPAGMARDMFGSGVEMAFSSRVPVKQHGIKPKEEERKPGYRIEKSSVLEKRATPSLSKGFKFTQSTSGVAKNKIALPAPTTQLTAPGPINQTVSNPNKSLLKKSSVTAKLKSALVGTDHFIGNAAVGSGKAVGKTTLDIVGHAGGKNINNLGKSINQPVKSFSKLKDSEKVKLVKSRFPEKEKELRTLLQKRDAARVAVVGAAGAGAYGGVKLDKKIKKVRAENAQRKLEEQYRQYYGN
jgi:hypothetical protein